MSRVIGSFFVGLVLSFLGLYLLGELAVKAGWETVYAENLKTARSAEEYQERVDRGTRPLILWLAVSGAFIGATLCGLYTANRAGKAAPRVGGTRTAADVALSPVEFERVRQCCLFALAGDRTPAYVQGLVVGRLADTAPELAAKVDKFSEPHMQALLQDLLEASGIG